MDVLSLFSLKDRTAIVTGAGSGIGQAIALGFAQAGAKVLAVGHSSIEETKEKAKAQGLDIITTTADLSKEEEIRRVVEFALREMGRIDILTYVSGTIRRSPAEKHSLEDWDTVMSLNLRGAFLMSQLVGQDMLTRGYGKIIHIASMLSFMGGLNNVSYTASKSGIAGLVRALANEWAGRGINVNAIAPGWIKTKLTKALQEDPNRYNTILARIPAGRWGDPEDLIGAAIFLASRASDYVNGHILAVDGGYLARG